jgi:hypothetical protein
VRHAGGGGLLGLRGTPKALAEQELDRPPEGSREQRSLQGGGVAPPPCREACYRARVRARETGLRQSGPGVSATRPRFPRRGTRGQRRSRDG